MSHFIFFKESLITKLLDNNVQNEKKNGESLWNNERKDIQLQHMTM